MMSVVAQGIVKAYPLLTNKKIGLTFTGKP